ncbi:hypothetical protein GCM10008024_11160 [Allgaiera indica]|uniref:Uncharacterized protein n=1 Tax=Allgaiera indica TaxID=765699 RepID=A0AAN4UPZ7_9RHOB|nr:hypothetical protein GCM10008024_11160 [Allgaiera indica]
MQAPPRAGYRWGRGFGGASGGRIWGTMKGEGAPWGEVVIGHKPRWCRTGGGLMRGGVEKHPGKTWAHGKEKLLFHGMFRHGAPRRLPGCRKIVLAAASTD